MKKLITLSPQQAKLMTELMEETYQTSASAFFVNLMVNYRRREDDANRQL